jgi:hypothetical protein
VGQVLLGHLQLSREVFISLFLEGVDVNRKESRMGGSVKSFLVGFLGAVVAVVVLCLLWVMVVTYQDHWKVEAMWRAMTQRPPMEQPAVQPEQPHGDK